MSRVIVSTTSTQEKLNEALALSGHEPVPIETTPAAAPTTDETDPPAVGQPDDQVPSDEPGTAPAPAAGSPQGDLTPEQQKKKSGLTKRVDELTRDLYTSRGENQALKDQIQELRNQIANIGKPPGATTPEAAPVAQPARIEKPTPPGVLPKQSAYDDYEQYETALDQWQEKNQKYQEDLAAWSRQQALDEFNQQTAAEIAQAELEERQQVWAASESTAREKHADYDAMTAPERNIMVSDAIVGAMLESEDFGEVKYWLGTHPEEAKQFTAETWYNPDTAKGIEIGAANRKAERIIQRIVAEIKGGAPAVPRKAATATGAPAGSPPAAPSAAPPARRVTTQAPRPAAPLRTGTQAPSPAPGQKPKVIGQVYDGVVYTAADFRRDTAKR